MLCSRVNKGTGLRVLKGCGVMVIGYFFLKQGAIPPYTINPIPLTLERSLHFLVKPFSCLDMLKIGNKILHEADNGGLVEGGLAEKSMQATEHVVYLLHGLAGCVADDAELMEAVPVYLLGFGIELLE